MSGPHDTFDLELLRDIYAVARMSASEPLPGWAQDVLNEPSSGAFISVSRSEAELSIVLPEHLIPDQQLMSIERDFRALRVKGSLTFDLVGIVAKLTTALAAVSIPVFVISTYETD